ncbi:MAG: hypothetical protein Kow00109_25360 [Acidobacteriota bacterium]
MNEVPNGQGNEPQPSISSEEREELERLLRQLHSEADYLAAMETAGVDSEAAALSGESREELIRRIHALERNMYHLYRIVRLVFEKTEILRMEPGRRK